MAETSDDFGVVCRKVEAVLGRSGGPLRWGRYPDADIMCVYGQNASPLHRARHGLDHIEEMSYTAAEHHPYYRLLNGIAEAARVLLDGWDGKIGPEDADRMRWSLSSVSDALDRMRVDG